MRVVIAGGGTGGHLFPGIAVADEFRKRDEEIEILFIGSEKGIEARVLPELGYPIKFIPTGALLGKSFLTQVRSMVRLIEGISASMKMLRARRPDVVIGTGGYVSAAPVIAAKLLGIPTLLMEQNLVPGFANRMLSKIASAIAVTYYESLPLFPRAKGTITGNPVRASILKGKRDKAVELFGLDPFRITILISGGSMGARRINEAMMSALNQLLDIRDGIQFLHQSGEADYDLVRRAYRDLGFKAMAAPFISQMAEAYALADVVVCRAGATTLAELTALGKPAILVPYPHAAGHQEFNARKLHESGGCVLVRDSELDGTKLAALLKEYYGSEEKRGIMRRQSRTLGRIDAAQRVADLAQTLMRVRMRHV
jgi:UDP-N-acetylglucosamine--N-acetylmuramyl-(pentapeptide) pyrophosphoryl-undecaprenol N-acetylglucosamine transferase